MNHVSLPYQYRDFAFTYLFKVKNEQELSLKILNLSQTCICKVVVSLQDLSFSSVCQLLEERDFPPVIESLVKKHLLPKDYLVPTRVERTQQMCGKLFDQILEQLKSKIFYEEVSCFCNTIFQHIRGNTDYRSLLSLDTMSEREKIIGNDEKIALISFIFAKYRWQERMIQQAIDILEDYQSKKGAFMPISLILVELYYQSGQSKQAFGLALKIVEELLLKQHVKQAILFCKHVLKEHPTEFSLYSRLATLLENPLEKVQVLLVGALEAMQQKDYRTGECLIEEAENISNASFIDGLISLEIMQKQGQMARFRKKLFNLGRALEEEGLFRQMLSAYKMLFQLEKNPEYAQKILFAYQILQNSQKEFEWSMAYLSMGVDHSEEVWALTNILKDAQRPAVNIHQYYEAAMEALIAGDHNRFCVCMREMKQIDPSLQLLSLTQRISLCMQEKVIEFSQKISIMQQRIFTLEQEIRALRQQTHQEISERAEEERDLLSSYFGKAKWEKYFGDVGPEPSLPDHILEILRSPCPYWQGKRVEDTHMLILIPKHVNGRPLTLNSLQELIRSPKEGGYSTEYYRFYELDEREMGDQTIPFSYWILMTKDVIPNSRNKTYSEQQALLNGRYFLPAALEIATGILMHYVETGERFYADDPQTYTRCKQRPGENFHLVVGSFRRSGLVIYDCQDSYCIGDSRYDYYGIGGVRRL